jgi:zinc/manganese transport system permease protein
MTDFFTFMAAPGLGCTLLAVIYTYFGNHVLRRGIIFVDLSLAQLAALGTTLALAMGWGEEGLAAQLASVFFIIAGATLFSLARKWFPRISQEAFIGIIYVVAASIAIVISSGTPHAAEHIQHMLNGSILWITWSQVGQLAILLCAMGIILKFFHPAFQELTESFHSNRDSSRPKVLWDFIFYLLLGLVIVFSVEKAGVFLIFSLLIIPSVCGTESSLRWSSQFLMGSLVGILGSWLGLGVSYWRDLPTGSTIVITLGGMLLTLLLFKSLFRKSR